MNGSDSYNGLDITYGVNFFKGGSDPVPCPDCPPAGETTVALKGRNDTPEVSGIHKEKNKDSEPKDNNSENIRDIKKVNKAFPKP